MPPRTDRSNVSFRNDGRLKLLIIVGTRPEVIRLSEVIKKCRRHFDCLLAHTGQNYDYTLNGIFFRDLELTDPDVYLDAVGADLGETVGNIIAASYKLMVQVRPDALLILGDTNSCLSAIAAKRLHIPIFHMEAGNRCKDECLPEETNRRIVDVISDVNLAYSEHARRYLKDTGCAPERTYVTGSPMAEVLRANLEKIEASKVLSELGLERKRFVVLCGAGNNGKDFTEGIKYHNCIGTYLHGPILPKNPRVADFLIRKALENKTKKFQKLEPLNDALERKAHKSAAKRPR